MLKPIGSPLAAVAAAAVALGLCVSPVAAKVTEITFATWGTPLTQKAHEHMAAEFAKLHPEIRVKPYQIGDWDVKITTMFAAGVGPDVMWFSNYGNALDWISKGLLFPLDSFIKSDKMDLYALFPRVAVDAQRYDGKTFGYRGSMYGLPKGINTDGLWYNKSVFDKGGVPYPTATWTWDDLLAAGQKLTKTGSDGATSQIGLGYEGEVWNWIYQAGGRLSDESGKIVLDSLDAIAGLQFWADLGLKYRISPAPGMKLPSGGSAQAWMSKDKTAMSLGAAWFPISFMTDKNIQRIGVAPLPNGKRDTSIIYTGGIGITKQSKHRKEAWEWIKYYTLDKKANVDHAANLEEWPPSLAVCRMPEVIRPKGFGLDIDRSALLDQFDLATIYIAPPRKPKRINDLMAPVFADIKSGKTSARVAIPPLTKRILDTIAGK